MRFLFFFTPCAIAGYMVYPYFNESKPEPEKANLPKSTRNVTFLTTVPEEDIIGSWVLSPRSTSLVSSSLGTSGRRLGLSLESWGGGTANLIIGDQNIIGPIAWSSKPGTEASPATLDINSEGQTFTLQFSKFQQGFVLITEIDSAKTGKKDFIRFLKVS